jgi:hypothetical protein
MIIRPKTPHIYRIKNDQKNGRCVGKKTVDVWDFYGRSVGNTLYI